jgi:hypothetical protein
LLNRKCFPEQLHGKPKQRAAARILASPVEIAGTSGEQRFPARPKFNMEEAQAAWRDFILMRDPGRPEQQRHRRKLLFLAAVAFPIKAAEQQCKKRQIVRVHREFARDSMAQITEDHPGMLQATADGAKKLPSAKAGLSSRERSRFSHGKSGLGKLLSLF